MLTEEELTATVAPVGDSASPLVRSRIRWLWAYIQSSASLASDATPLASIPGGPPSQAPGAPGPAAGSLQSPAPRAPGVDPPEAGGAVAPPLEDVETLEDMQSATAPSVPTPPLPSGISFGPATAPTPVAPTVTSTPPITLPMATTFPSPVGPLASGMAVGPLAPGISHFWPSMASMTGPSSSTPGIAGPRPAAPDFSVAAPPITVPTPTATSVYSHGPPMNMAIAAGQVRLDRTVDQHSTDDLPIALP